MAPGKIPPGRAGKSCKNKYNVNIKYVFLPSSVAKHNAHFSDTYMYAIYMEPATALLLSADFHYCKIGRL